MKTLLGVLLCGVFWGCSSMPEIQRQSVKDVNLKRFMGDWYVIALLPWFAEKGNVNTMDIYHLRDDGKISITYAFRKKDLKAPVQQWKAVGWVPDAKNTGHWKVQFIWPFSVDYLVVDLAPDYRYTAIGHPSKKFLWIMSREPQMDPEDFAKVSRRAAQLGYDVSALERVPQPQK